MNIDDRPTLIALFTHFGEFWKWLHWAWWAQPSLPWLCVLGAGCWRVAAGRVVQSNVVANSNRLRVATTTDDDVRQQHW